MASPTPWIAGVLVALSVSAGPMGAAAETSPVAFVHVIGASVIPRWELQRAESDVTRAFKRIDVEVRWLHDDGPPEWRESVRHLSLVLLSESATLAKAESDRLGDGVLGTSIRQARRSYIFCPRIERLADAANIHLADPLAFVLMHEIGHLLLPDAGHAETGVMRPVLPPPGRVVALRFTALEAQAIRAALNGSAVDQSPRLARAAGPRGGNRAVQAAPVR